MVSLNKQNRITSKWKYKWKTKRCCKKQAQSLSAEFGCTIFRWTVWEARSQKEQSTALFIVKDPSLQLFTNANFNHYQFTTIPTRLTWSTWSICSFHSLWPNSCHLKILLIKWRAIKLCTALTYMTLIAWFKLKTLHKIKSTAIWKCLGLMKLLKAVTSAWPK